MASGVRKTHAVKRAAEGVFITNRNGFIDYVCPAFKRLMGLGRDEMVRRKSRLSQSGHEDQSFSQQLWGTVLAE